jgi:hypothetical protein
MKIGTLTFHTAQNYGAMLQAYALVRYIQSLGYDAEIIDYQSEFNAKRFSSKPFSHFLHIREIYNVLFRNAYLMPCPEAFRNFYENFLPKSAESYGKDQLAMASKSYDVIISGSDQVWNLACTEGDDSYFLPFVSHEKKYSYAASIGVTKISENLKGRISDYIVSFKGISVREHEAVKIIKELTGREAILVVDPTLLLTKEQWANIADYSRCPHDKYLLIYVMSEDVKLLKFAKRYAKNHNLKIAYVSQRLFKRINAIYLRNVTPNQWIGLFLRADTIVTNSFHGSAFGVNFGKNLFVKYIPRSIANSRLQTLVNDYGLNGHLLKNDTAFLEKEEVDMDKVLSILNKYRSLSYEYLLNILSYEA